jgi:sulfite reductase alpha subunit-like flavoprotein
MRHSVLLLCALLLQVPCGSYYAGDEVAVWAENSPDTVAAMASALGITEGELDSMFLMQKNHVRAPGTL